MPNVRSEGAGEDVNSLEAYWMPFTANRSFKAAPRLVVKGKGVEFWDNRGHRVLDASSGLFCCPAGHGRKEIADAVYKQLQDNSYTPQFQLGHPSAFTFAEVISRMLPEGMDYVFFTNSGSEAIDTAIKVALAYHRARGEGQRTRFISRERAYHGVNMGGLSLSGMVRNRENFALTLPNMTNIRHTLLEENRFHKGQPETGAYLADDLQRICETYGASTIAAVFVEPVAGSTGILVPPKGYLQRLREICTNNGILLVFDEVITGFGRLGKPFAAHAFDVVPDIATMAKALTNGSIPMGAVGAQENIYKTITGIAGKDTIEFAHGYTYSAHPAACAAGLATMKIYQQEGLFERAAELTPYFLDAVWSLKDQARVIDIRGHGLMAGIEIDTYGEDAGVLAENLQKEMFLDGLHVKWTGNSALMTPAFVSEKRHIDEMIDLFRKTLDSHKTTH